MSSLLSVIHGLLSKTFLMSNLLIFLIKDSSMALLREKRVNEFPWKDTGFGVGRSVLSLQPIRGHSQNLFPHLQNEGDITSALVSTGDLRT